MDCPRCGAPNLPGLPVCTDCGQDLAAQVPIPAAFVPRVAASNPLAERRPRPPRRARARFRPFAHVGRLRHLPWEAFGAGLLGVVRGSVPGLMPALRGERRRAWIQLAAVLVPAAILLLAGGLHALGRWGFFVVLGWSLSPFEEARRSMDTPEPFRTSAAWLLCIGPALALTLALRVGLAPPPALTFTFNLTGSLLPGRSFAIERGDGPFPPGTLVAFARDDVEERLARLGALIAADGAGDAGPHPTLATYGRYLRSYAYFASPVVAVEGEVLAPVRGGARADGDVRDLLPIASWPRAPLAFDLAHLPVPAGYLLVWDWLPYPEDHTLHLTLIPREAVLGRITQVLVPGGAPVDLRWPEDARLPSQNPEPP